MCKPINCSVCGNVTWMGCGMHVPIAMGTVPKEQWCTCVPVNGPSNEFPPKYGYGKAA